MTSMHTFEAEDLFSPSSSTRGSAEPMRRPPSPSPAIDFDSIDDPYALKALLKAREEKMRTLEKRVEIAQGAKNKLKERYSEKIEMLEQLVIALRRKLQTKVDEVKKLGGTDEDSGYGDSSVVDGKFEERLTHLQKQNEGLKEMVSIQKNQLAAAKAEAEAAKLHAKGAGASSGAGADVSVLSKMEEKVHELTAALQTRSRECRAQAQLLEQKETKIMDLQSAIVNLQNKSPDASGLSRKVQMLNGELEEARSMGTELMRQRDRLSAEYEALKSVVDNQGLEKEQLLRENADRAAQLISLQKERDRKIKETEEMQRMLCELEDQRNQLATEAGELKNEVSQSMSRSMNASLIAEREGKQVELLKHEAATLRKHLESSQKATKENEMLQLELRIAVDRNAKLEADILSAQNDLSKERASSETSASQLQHVREQHALQMYEIQQATARKLDEAATRVHEIQQATARKLEEAATVERRLQGDHDTLVQRCETLQRELVLRDQETDRCGQELHHLRMSLDVLTSNNKQLDMDLAGARALIEKMDAQRSVDESEAVYLREQLAAGEAWGQQVDQERQKIAKDLANARDGNTNLQDRVSVLTTQLQSRARENEELRQDVAVKERELLHAATTVERMKQDMAARDARIHELTDHATHMRQEHDQISTVVAKMRGEKDHLLTQAMSDAEVRQSLEAQIQELRESVKGGKAASERLTVELKSKDESLANLVAARANLSGKVAELETKLGDKDFEVEDRDRQLTVAHNRILGLEARLRDTDAKNREAESEADKKVATLESEVKDLTRRLEAKMHEVAQQHSVIASLQLADQEREQEQVKALEAVKMHAQVRIDKLTQELQDCQAAVEERQGVMSRLEHDVAGHKREQYDLQAKLAQEAARLEAAQQLNQELQVQLEYAQEQLSLGQRALEQNRSQNIIMDELRHRLASHDELLREKDAQVRELIAQRDDAEHTLFEFRGTSEGKDMRARGLEDAQRDLQQQLVSAVAVGQGYHAEAQRLREKAERTKLVVVRRIISQWLYESVSQAFYGWSSLIGVTSRSASPALALQAAAVQHAGVARHATARAVPHTEATSRVSTPPGYTSVSVNAVYGIGGTTWHDGGQRPATDTQLLATSNAATETRQYPTPPVSSAPAWATPPSPGARARGIPATLAAAPPCHPQLSKTGQGAYAPLQAHYSRVFSDSERSAVPAYEHSTSSRAAPAQLAHSPPAWVHQRREAETGHEVAEIIL